ncbi:MAG TPA: hypothetical protein VGI81_25730 [Tepidisphaeraceae bacterium]|jgi:hypothetical protein
MTRVAGRRTCERCGTDVVPGHFRTDTAEAAWCDDCFRELRVATDGAPGSDADGPRFRCGACGTEHPAAELRELAGQVTCDACISQRNANGQNSPQTTPEKKSDVSPADDAAEEAKQIVASLHGSVPPNLLPKITCPHCWHAFEPHEILWVAQHVELMGDPVLGPEAPARFLPSRFNAAGEALDARDMSCQVLACPRCHLIIPRALIETPPIFVSLIGAPASGKSHLLASMTWELRRTLRDRFAIVFNDADALSNLSIHRYEETLFVNGEADRLVSIRKTELQGELYDQIRLGQQIVSLPRPFLFTMRTQAKPAASDRLRVMCLYDNAGEHFQPGMDSAAAPGTQHMARSKALMFLFDPTQHPGFREHCRMCSDDPQLYRAARTLRQETILTEAASRVRRYAGLSPQNKHDRPLVVVVSKADIWAPLLEEDLSTEPLLPDPSQPGTDMALVDIPRIERTSAALRKMLLRYTPEIVAAAEDFCHTIVYIPASALGRGPELQEETGMLGIRPRDIRPQWAAAPILYLFAKWSALLPAAAKTPARAAASAPSVPSSSTSATPKPAARSA